MKKRHEFHTPMHIIGKYDWKGCGGMECQEQEQTKDVDDLIFGEEEWYPSSR